MWKRINWRAIGIACAWICSLSGLFVLMSFISIHKQDLKCSNVKILIPGSKNFIEREEIDAILREGEGVLIGRNLSQLNIQKIENKLRSNPYIGFAKVYFDMDGTLKIEVKQRKPVLRVINATGQDFYIDDEGLKMPMSSNFTADVLVATGKITEVFGQRVDTLRTQLAKDLYRTAAFINQDTLWHNQIEQIYVNAQEDMELVPLVGDFRIILGDAHDLQPRMDNLKFFTINTLPNMGWDAYSTINIKYKDQIVGEKRKEKTQKASASPVETAQVLKKVTDSLVQNSIKSALQKN